MANLDDDVHKIVPGKYELPEALLPMVKETIWGWRFGTVVGDYIDNK